VSVHNEELTGYLRRRHSVSKLVVHVIFTTKYRRRLLDGEIIMQIRQAFNSAAESLEIEILEMDGETDHVHILVAYPPKLSISMLVNNLKSTSSRYVRILNTHTYASKVIVKCSGHDPISPVVLAAQQSKH
jgi:putative transposase